MTETEKIVLTTRNVCDRTFQKEIAGEGRLNRESRLLFNKNRLKIFPTKFPNFTSKRTCFGDIKHAETATNQVSLLKQINLRSNNNILFIENFGRTDCSAINSDQYDIAQKNGWTGIIVHGGIRGSGVLAKKQNPKLSLRGCFPHPHNWFKLEPDELQSWEDNRLYDPKSYDFVIADNDAVVFTTRKLLEYCGFLQQQD